MICNTCNMNQDDDDDDLFSICVRIFRSTSMLENAPWYVISQKWIVAPAYLLKYCQSHGEKARN